MALTYLVGWILSINHLWTEHKGLDMPKVRLWSTSAIAAMNAHDAINRRRWATARFFLKCAGN